jgi:hypothetical protein
MKTVEVKTYTNLDGKHYFGGAHVVDDDVAEKLITKGAVELSPPVVDSKPVAKAPEKK